MHTMNTNIISKEKLKEISDLVGSARIALLEENMATTSSSLVLSILIAIFLEYLPESLLNLLNGNSSIFIVAYALIELYSLNNATHTLLDNKNTKNMIVRFLESNPEEKHQIDARIKKSFIYNTAYSFYTLGFIKSFIEFATASNLQLVKDILVKQTLFTILYAFYRVYVLLGKNNNNEKRILEEAHSNCLKEILTCPAFSVLYFEKMYFIETSDKIELNSNVSISLHKYLLILVSVLTNNGYNARIQYADKKAILTNLGVIESDKIAFLKNEFEKELETFCQKKETFKKALKFTNELNRYLEKNNINIIFFCEKDNEGQILIKTQFLGETIFHNSSEENNSDNQTKLNIINHRLCIDFNPKPLNTDTDSVSAIATQINNFVKINGLLTTTENVKKSEELKRSTCSDRSTESNPSFFSKVWRYGSNLLTSTSAQRLPNPRSPHLLLENIKQEVENIKKTFNTEKEIRYPIKNEGQIVAYFLLLQKDIKSINPIILNSLFLKIAENNLLGGEHIEKTSKSTQIGVAGRVQYKMRLPQVSGDDNGVLFIEDGDISGNLRCKFATR